MFEKKSTNWIQKPLSNLGKYINGFAFKPDDWKSQGLPIIRIAQITGSSSECDYYQGILSDVFKIDSGDLIFSWSGTLKVVEWDGGPAWLNQHLFKVIPSPEVHQRFLYHILAASVEEMNKRAHGSTMKHIKRNELKEYLVYLPSSFEEQKTIANVLDILDTQIRQTETIIAKLQQIKQGLLHDLLTRGIDDSGQLRPTYEQAPALYKESPLGWIPREWNTSALIDVSEIKSGSTPSRELFERYFEDGSYLWVKTLDLNEGVVNETSEFITDKALSETSCVLFPEKTVLIAMYGGWEQIGRTAILGKDAATNQAISALQFESEVIPEFALRAIQFGRHRWASIAASTRKDPNITKNDVEDFLISFPMDCYEQRLICRKYKVMLKRIKREEEKLKKLKKQKTGLMDDLLTGRVRVTELINEPQAS